MLLGYSQIRKTSLFRKYLYNNFSNSNVFSVDKKKINSNFKFFLYDPLTLINFRNGCANFLKSANGIKIVYDLTNKQSFENLPCWLKIVEESEEMPLIIVVGNKSELDDNREVTLEETNQFWKEFNFCKNRKKYWWSN